jgi:23S rRNA G2445 N2-methylase RlmL
VLAQCRAQSLALDSTSLISCNQLPHTHRRFGLEMLRLHAAQEYEQQRRTIAQSTATHLQTLLTSSRDALVIGSDCNAKEIKAAQHNWNTLIPQSWQQHQRVSYVSPATRSVTTHNSQLPTPNSQGLFWYSLKTEHFDTYAKHPERIAQQTKRPIMLLSNLPYGKRLDSNAHQVFTKLNATIAAQPMIRRAAVLINTGSAERSFMAAAAKSNLSWLTKLAFKNGCVPHATTTWYTTRTNPDLDPTEALQSSG